MKFTIKDLKTSDKGNHTAHLSVVVMKGILPIEDTIYARLASLDDLAIGMEFELENPTIQSVQGDKGVTKWLAI